MDCRQQAAVSDRSAVGRSLDNQSSNRRILTHFRFGGNGQHAAWIKRK
jgi:hypothetical protein